MNTNLATRSQLARCRRPLAAASLTVLAVTAWAGNPDPGAQRSEKISVKDLDLTTAHGLEAAHARVDQAARRLCFAVSHPDDRSRRSNYLKCVEDSVATAMLQFGATAGTRVAERSVGQRNVQ